MKKGAKTEAIIIKFTNYANFGVFKPRIFLVKKDVYRQKPTNTKLKNNNMKSSIHLVCGAPLDSVRDCVRDELRL